jgi:competence protein ComEC
VSAWLLPAAAAAVWAGLLLAPRWPEAAGPPAALALGAAALAAGWLAAPPPDGGDRLEELGLVAPAPPVVRAVAPARPRRAIAWPAAALALAGLVLVGIGRGALAQARLETSPLARLATARVEVEAVVRDDPRPTAVGWWALVTATGVRGQAGAFALRERLWISGDDAVPAVHRGDLVRIEGRLDVPTDEGFRAALAARGVAATLRVGELVRLGPSPNPFVRATQVVRAQIARSIRSVFPPREAGLLLGLALGEERGLDPELVRDFRATGLTHLLVVSGGNVAMLLGPLLGTAAALGLGTRGRGLLGLGGVAFLVVLTGAEPSVLRAGGMAAITLLGALLGRPRSTGAALGAAVLVCLVWDPTLARSIGFQLSAAATAGLVAMAGPIEERLVGVLPRPVAIAAAATCAAQLGVLPLLLAYVGEVPGVTLPANVLAAPTVAPSLVGGLLVALCGLAWPPLGRVLAPVALVPMRALELVADLGARAPIAHLTSRGGVAAIAAGGVVVAVIALWLRGLWRPPRRAVVVAVAALPLLVWAEAVSSGPPDSLTVRFLDVGQGDAALVTSPGGATVLVDGGPDEELVAHELAALGVKRLDVVVASHPHADHIVGLPAVLARFPVGLVLQPGCPDTSALQAELDRAIAEEGVPVRTPRAGDRFRAQDLWIDVLSPHRCWTGTESDANNDALVLRVRRGDDVVLFATEPEEPAQEWLLASGTDLRADVLKVPHHGAATSVSAFFDAVAAEVAVVSVGENPYGHPVPSTLTAIAASGAAVWRTDERGTITVSFAGGVPVVRTER